MCLTIPALLPEGLPVSGFQIMPVSGMTACVLAVWLLACWWVLADFWQDGFLPVFRLACFWHDFILIISNLADFWQECFSTWLSSGSLPTGKKPVSGLPDRVSGASLTSA